MTKEAEVFETPGDDDILQSITEGFAALGTEPEKQTDNESGADNEDAQDDASEDTQEVDESAEGDGQDDEPKQIDKPKGRRAQKEYERAEAEKAARLALEAKYAALEAKVNNLSDVKSLLEPKKPDPTIDDELKQFGIDPKSFEDSYDESGNLEMSAKAQKKLALQEAKTNATIGQMQAQNTISRTANDVNAAITHLQTANPEMAEMLDNGLTLLVSNQAFITQANNPQMSEQEADLAAYNAIMYELARRSQQMKKSPALIAAEMADGLAKRLNVPLLKQKPLHDNKKSGNINIDKAKSLQAKAGAAPIKVASTKQSSDGGLSSGFRDYLQSELG